MLILLATASVLAALLYCAAWWLAGRPEPNLTSSADVNAGAQAVRVWSMGNSLMFVGLLLHVFSIAISMRAPMPVVTVGSATSAMSVAAAAADSAMPVLRFGFAPALSAVLCLGVAILWFQGLRTRLDALRVIVLPMAAIAALLPLFFPGADHSGLARAPLFFPHLLVGTLAIGVLVMAAMHALLMMAADQMLHHRSPSKPPLFARWFDQMPPLMALERLLFQFISIGFVLLTLTVGSGVLFSEQVFGRALRFDHKSAFSIAAWILFGILLIGRYLWGWRGRMAWRMTLAGVAFLLLGYIGSRFVLEVVLKRY
jgi:ABC-type uncharacterized transport system permease subunit